MHTAFAYAADLLALFVASLALVVARAKGPTAWARRVLDLEVALADVEERLDATREQLAKWRGRAAAREQRAAATSDADDVTGEPDPIKNPAAWKAWVNSGGITQLNRRKRNG
jgi:hypothetical protein